MRIKGYLNTVRPIHVTAQTDGNATGISTEPVPDYRSGFMTRVPFVPSTVLRGGLRRAASDMATEEMMADGMTVPVEIFNALRHGSNSGKLVNEPVSPSFFTAQREHPVMGLFGGGPRQGAGGMLSVAPLYPLCIELLEKGMVPQHPGVEVEPPAYKLITEATMYPRLDIMREDDPSYDAVIEDKEARIDEVIAADVARRVGKGAEGGGTESTLRSSNLLTYSYMVPGVFLMLDLKVDPKAPDHSKGMLLLALMRFLNANRIGGMQRIGIGADVFSLGGAAASLKMMGDPVFAYDGDELTIAEGGEAERLAATYAAWSDGGKAWRRDDLWKATGFAGIDMSAPAVKKAAPGKGGKAGK